MLFPEWNTVIAGKEIPVLLHTFATLEIEPNFENSNLSQDQRRFYKCPGQLRGMHIVN